MAIEHFFSAHSEWEVLIAVTLVPAITRFKQSTLLCIFKEIALRAVFIFFKLIRN